jgi:hypothetical protein
VKGSGTFFISVATRNGGFVQAGDCPGVITVGSLVFGPGGATGLVVCMNNATGVAGPTPDGNDQVSGWSLINVNGDFAITADAVHRLTINLQTLANPTTPGNDVAGPMDHFDAAKSYVWEVAHWTGTYTGPTDAAALNAAVELDTGAMANAAGGKFSVRLDTASQALSVVYTPPPSVAAVQLNDSGSGVQSITVTFSTAVTFAGNPAAAFLLTNLDTGANVMIATAVSTDAEGRTVVTLTFNDGALAAGHYRLGIASSAITGTDGSALDGTGLGLSSSDYLGPIWTVG